MSTTIRQKLIDYITVADEIKIDAIYTLLQSEINKETALSVITDESKTLKVLSKKSVINQGQYSSKKETNSELKTPVKYLQPLLTEILNKKYVIVSVVGSHAGKDIHDILYSKINEVNNNYKTYWLLKSHKAKTHLVQKFCEQAEMEGEYVYCLFVNASTKNGSRETVTETRVKHISHNNSDWINLADNVIITGLISQQSTALVISELMKLDKPLDIDLWNYSEYPDNTPIKFQPGMSTVIAEKKPSKGMKSRLRKLVAWGRLESPFAVWIK